MERSEINNEELRTKNNKEKPFRFLLVNQFLPPDPAPTARLLGDVAAELRARGHETDLVGDRASYHGHKTLCGSRALRELLSLVRLFARALFTRRADVIVCLSSPPLLPVVARMALFRHRGAKLIHWAMDLYPDVAVAVGEVREGSALHRMTSAMMGRVYRSCDLIVTLDDDMAARIGLHGGSCTVQPPWPPAFPCTPGAARGQSGFTWLYSGNLGRAHEWRTLLDVQHQLENAGVEINLVFQGGGTEHEAASHYAKSLGLTRCLWQPYASDAELIPSLLQADCLIVTQRPETTGCLWPSKLALALLLDRAILWVGSSDSAVTSMLHCLGHHCFVPDETLPLTETLKGWVAGRSGSARECDLPIVMGRINEARREGISRLAATFEGTLTDSA